MKYEIDTIPVWDALRAATECPLCLLEKRSRQAALRYYLGPSVMVPEIRVKVNEQGFSPANLRLLAKDPNKLGLALISHTRLKTFHARWNAQVQTLKAEAAKAAQKGVLGGMLGSKALRDQLEAAAAFLRDEEARCLIEDKVKADGERYAFTLLHLWQNDPEFKAVWGRSPGTCLHHAPGLLTMAGQQMAAPALGAFVVEFLQLLDEHLGRAERDVLAFTQTFDSTHSHVIEGNPQGAVDRCLQTMAGLFPEYEDESRARRGPLMGGVAST